jgi:hypothetical protein
MIKRINLHHLILKQVCHEYQYDYNYSRWLSTHGRIKFICTRTLLFCINRHVPNFVVHNNSDSMEQNPP